MRATFVVMLASLGAAAGAAVAAASTSDKTPPLYGEIERGRYLSAAGDCKACHTADGGKPFAGGRAVPTPFGTIYAPNITPDKETGIGNWTEDQFWKSMHEGLLPDGTHLYPAMPYPWYTKLTRDDVLAIKAYLDTLPAVRSETKKPALPFPLSWRESVAAWNRLFFDPGTYQADARKSAQWNRGAYLVEGAGHCGACHSPKNVLGAVKQDQRFQGGKGEGWFAVNLTSDPREGVGSWSEDEIVQYLKTGATKRARAMGPMGEVVEHSTSHLSDADLHAIATYLKDLPAPQRGKSGDDKKPAQDVMTRGRLVYLDQCAGCHMENGEGVAGVFPPLKGNTGLQAHNPLSLARLVLEGAKSVKTAAHPEGFAMPAFGGKLSDAQVADVLTYARTAFGGNAGSITKDQVADVRKQVSKQAYAKKN
jgi:mono/diheme cytochrome c family protein